MVLKVRINRLITKYEGAIENSFVLCFDDMPS